MANIQEVQGKNGVKYRVLIRLKGCPAQSATFARKTDAKKWAQDVESAIRDGRHFKTVEAKRHTVADMIDKYISEVVPGKKDTENTTRQLCYWKEQIGAKLLADVTTALIVSIRDHLLKEPYTTTRQTAAGVVATERLRSKATVNRYLAAFSHCLSIASSQWGWLESSPAVGIKKQGSPTGASSFLV